MFLERADQFDRYEIIDATQKLSAVKMNIEMTLNTLLTRVKN